MGTIGKGKENGKRKGAKHIYIYRFKEINENRKERVERVKNVICDGKVKRMRKIKRENVGKKGREGK